MKFFTYLLMAFAVTCMVMATDDTPQTPSSPTTFVDIKAEIDLLLDNCNSLSQIQPNGVSVGVEAQISAQIQAVVAVFVDLHAIVQAYVGVLAIVEVDAIVQVLVDVQVYLQIAVQVLVAIQIGGNCGNDLLDLQVSIKAFIEAFLAIVPDESKDAVSDTCQQIQDSATQACTDYNTC